MSECQKHGATIRSQTLTHQIPQRHPSPPCTFHYKLAGSHSCWRSALNCAPIVQLDCQLCFTGDEHIVLYAREPVARPSVGWIATLRLPRALPHIPAVHRLQPLSIPHVFLESAFVQGCGLPRGTECPLVLEMNEECTECQLDRFAGPAGALTPHRLGSIHPLMEASQPLVRLR